MATSSRTVIPFTFLSWFDRTVYCWRPVDEKAQHDFRIIEPKIQDRIRPMLLEAIYQDFDLVACLFGKSDNIREAQPYIVLASRDARRVRRARELIISSGLLKTVPTRFKIETMPSTPYGAVIEVASNAPDMPPSAEDSLRRVKDASNQNTTQHRNYKVFYKPSDYLSNIGLEIFIWTSDKNLRRATGHVVFREVKPEYLCLTAAHAFDSKSELGREANWGAGYRFTIDDDIHVDKESTPSPPEPPRPPVRPAPENLLAYIPSNGFLGRTVGAWARKGISTVYNLWVPTREETRVNETGREEMGTNIDTETPPIGIKPDHEKTRGRPRNIPEEPLPDIKELETLGNLKHISFDCDWAVIEVTSEELIQTLLPTAGGTSIASIRNSDDMETKVTACTYDGELPGILLPGSISRKVSGGQTMKRVLLFQVTYNATAITGLIRKGDCGSPVVDLTTGKLYGHIISVSEDGRIAFVMSAPDAFSAMKTEANVGPVSWGRSGSSKMREENSLRGDKLEMGHIHMVATAETWMDRHNTLVVNRKKFCKLPPDDSKRIKIAMVNVEDYVEKKHVYGKWAEQLSELLSEMAPYATIRRSSTLSTKIPVGSVNLSKAVLRHDVGWVEEKELEGKVTLDEFNPHIIVLVSTFGRRNYRDMDSVSEYAEYAEKQEILLLVSAPEVEESQKYLRWRSKSSEMIRVYSADGQGNTLSRLTTTGDDDQGIMTLGECVRSTSWRRSGPQLERLGNGTYGRLVSGNGCAAVVAAGIAAMVLRCMQGVLMGEEWRRLRRTNTMYALLRSMGEMNERSGLVWIKHWEWLGTGQRELELEKLVRGVL